VREVAVVKRPLIMGKGAKPPPKLDRDVGAAPVHTSAHVQLLGLGLDGSGAVPSVLLFFDKTRFLFNAGEGFQRFCVEHKLRLGRLSTIFLTRADADAANGLPGLFLTVADTAAAAKQAPVELALFGPPRVEALTASIATVVSNARHCRVRTHALSETSTSAYRDEHVSITPFLLQPAGTAEFGDQPRAAEAKRARGSPGDVPPAAESVCYLCELSDVPGKFDPVRAAALGVRPGPDFGRLVRGETVMATQPGAAAPTEVHPGEVMSATQPGPAFLIVDLPTPAHLAVSLAHARLGGHAPVLTSGLPLSLIIHLTPPAVAALPEYIAWATRLGGDGTAHWMANADAACHPVVFRASATLSAKLALLQPRVFPPLPQAVEAEDACLSTPGPPPPPPTPVGAPLGAIAGENLARWKLRPLASAGLDRLFVPPAMPSSAALLSQLRLEAPEVLALAAAARAAWDTPVAALPTELAALSDEEGFELLFLGTGAAIPSKYRNVSGILVRVPGDAGCLLLDCGEGSLGQLRRRYGTDGCDTILRTLRLAWISHIHADHHVGLLSVLAARSRLLGPDAPPLPVVGPWPLRRFLELHAAGVEPLAFRFLDLATTTAERLDEAAAAAEQVDLDGGKRRLEDDSSPAALFAAAVRRLGLGRLHSVPVIHCAHAYGCVLEATHGWKVVYSGDTRPCAALAAAAQGAAVLIHEATFEDALEAEAVAKRHSSTKDALAAGRAAGAFRTLLTHFSQRYPKVPMLDDSGIGDGGAAVAFDLMSVRLSDLGHLPALLPPLRALFNDAADVEEVDVFDDE
jgi:ribonuclease Z